MFSYCFKLDPKVFYFYFKTKEISIEFVVANLELYFLIGVIILGCIYPVRALLDNEFLSEFINVGFYLWEIIFNMDKQFLQIRNIIIQL